jgi:hypothetical protein
MGSNREYVPEFNENAFRQGGKPCPETVQRDQRLAVIASNLTLIAAVACVRGLGLTGFFAYVSSVTSGEIG